MKRSFLALVAVAFLLGSGCEAPPPVEPVTIAEDVSVELPELAQKLVENDQVRVTRFVLKPREALPLHEGLDRVIYSLGRYRLRFELQNQTGEVKDFNEGDIHWHTAAVHSASNSGTLTASYLSVERKQSPPIPEKESDLMLKARGYAYSAFSNDDVRVVQVDLVGKGRVPKHFGNGQVISVVTAGKAKFTGAGETIEKEFEAGDSFWLEAGDRTVQNLSADPLRFLVVEFKE